METKKNLRLLPGVFYQIGDMDGYHVLGLDDLPLRQILKGGQGKCLLL
jgi:hypothetical protein